MWQRAAYTEDERMFMSIQTFLDGLNKEEAIAKIVAWLEERLWTERLLPSPRLAL